MPLTPQELRQRRLALLATSAKAAPDAKALLDTANSASQTVAVLHVAFMAVCAYVLVIVFGTTDLDLLMGGNNVKLPVIDVAVPIVGFYAFAPYLVVLMHLNLLLQLQLLSRKLFAFDAATPADESVGGLRDRLHIFPYTYYLVGRPGVVVGGLLGLVVSVSLIVLPLATLLALQLKFLAYQAEGITWAQRIAVFLDVGFLVALWPVILHPRDDWKAWWRETLAAHLPKKRAWLAVIVLVASVILILFAATPDIFTVGLILGVAAPLLLIVLDGGFPDERIRRAIILFAVILGLLAVLWKLISDSKDSLPSTQLGILIALFLGALPLSFFWHPKAPRGSLALLSALVLGPFLTLGLMVDGEFWETTTTKEQEPIFAWQMLDREQRHVDNPEEFKMGNILVEQFEDKNCASTGQTVLSCIVLAEQRRLDLNEQSLFTKPPNPELLAALRAGKGLENVDKLERISLAGRSLRHAQMRSALLVGADLRYTQIQGANLLKAQLQDADLSFAQLWRTNLSFAQLQSTRLIGTDFQNANLKGAQLQGASLFMTFFSGTNLSGAQLQGMDLAGMVFWSANLGMAQLQGANLTLAALQGADLWDAQLQGANLRAANLDGADLRGASLQGADLRGAKLQNADLLAATIHSDVIKVDFLDLRKILTKPLLKEESLKLQMMLKDISFSDKKESLQRLKRVAVPINSTPTFFSCLPDRKNQPMCQQIYDATNLEQRHKFMNRLHEILATLACDNVSIASGIIKQVPGARIEKINEYYSPTFGEDTIVGVPSGDDSTRAGLATVLLARMKASEPCPGLADLFAEDKTKLEELVKREAKREQAAKAASAVRQ